MATTKGNWVFNSKSLSLESLKSESTLSQESPLRDRKREADIESPAPVFFWPGPHSMEKHFGDALSAGVLRDTALCRRRGCNTGA
jgi:hypothetical protein